ncbi:ABC transporter ATP-binding protein [Nodosilinea sp. LEGE 06152]|uniref:ABC transporter ATP-binding protein n=1 Tax=Nodosilinea sp. LEGE 06152 TaxID=2777966 RepID=UPI0018800F51|nr:ABC transporter ATP-binding protein [Nodosilinea sp. LEGE 06152]MBE9157091.1 ABC transporter ATP-binding protein [Nodosilinea sp. LEGE 06152]
MALIELDRVSKTYGSGELTVHALHPVSLTIEAGEYCAIVGPSGSGKSTAMAILGCLDRPTAGTYRLDGHPVNSLGADALAEIRNRTLGFVFQQFYLLPQLSALENVMLPMVYANLPKAKRRSRATRALQKVGLGNRLHNRPSQLSGGQQQRVAIARAIVNRPKLLLADEPTGALDSQTSQSVMNIFADLNRDGMTVIMVTHDREVAGQCDRTISFRDGHLVADSHPPALLTPQSH